MQSQWDLLPQNSLNSTLYKIYEDSIPMKQKEKIKGQKYILDWSFNSKWLTSKHTEKRTRKNHSELFFPLSCTGHCFSFCESIIEIITHWNYLSEDLWPYFIKITESLSSPHYPWPVITFTCASPVLLLSRFESYSCARVYLYVLSISTLAKCLILV